MRTGPLLIFLVYSIFLAAATPIRRSKRQFYRWDPFAPMPNVPAASSTVHNQTSAQPVSSNPFQNTFLQQQQPQQRPAQSLNELLVRQPAPNLPATSNSFISQLILTGQNRTNPGVLDTFLNSQPVVNDKSGVNVGPNSAGDIGVDWSKKWTFLDTGFQQGGSVDAGANNPGYTGGWNVPIFGQNFVANTDYAHWDMARWTWMDQNKLDVGPFGVVQKGNVVSLPIIPTVIAQSLMTPPK